MKKILKNMDIGLLICVIFMCIIGIFAVLSASSVTSVFNSPNGSPYYFFKRQLLFMVISFIIGFFVLAFPMKFIQKHTYKLTLVGMILLVAVLIIGDTVNGTKGWLNLGIASIQPSEFMKLIMILFMGKFFSNPNKEMNKGSIFTLVTIIASALGLILLENDAGTSIILFGILALLLISIPLKKGEFTKILNLGISAAIILVIMFLAFGNQFISEYQKQRLNIKEPCKRYLQEGTGYQVCNGFIAINNGGLFGVGIGNSTQKYLYLPEAHTDFIFPIIVEEVGVIAATFVILMYFFIVYRLFYISKTSTNLRNSIISKGVMYYIMIHFVINIGGVLSIIPLTGVPLLFLSSGGSALFTTIISIFIVLRISAENKIERNIRKIKSI